MIERHVHLAVPRIDSVGSGRYSVMCWRCRRSAVVVARTSVAAWLLLAGDGWHRTIAAKRQEVDACLASCPECTALAS